MKGVRFVVDEAGQKTDVICQPSRLMTPSVN